MSTWMRLIMAVVVGAHGIGHILFLVPLLGSTDWGQSTRSWLLGSGWLARGLGGAVWLAALLGFTAVAGGLFFQAEWWRTAAIISAAISILGLLLFWSSPGSSPAISALLFNLLVLGALLVFHWPPLVRAAS